MMNINAPNFTNKETILAFLASCASVMFGLTSGRHKLRVNKFAAPIDIIAAGTKASVIGIALVVTFMVAFYGLFGLFANIAMIINAFMTLALLALFEATLTLPGIAGIVLTVGMAVDANVLIYERMREELRHGKSPYAAIEDGFRLAFGTIFDSHVTTLVAALILFQFGTGTVKGFAVTLAVGIICSLYTAVLVTRLMVVTWLKYRRPKTLAI